MKTNHKRARAEISSKQARKTTVKTGVNNGATATATVQLPERRFADLNSYFGSDEHRERVRKCEETDKQVQRREALASIAQRGRQCFTAKTLPGLANHWEFDASVAVLFLARVLFTHREAITAAVVESELDGAGFRDRMALAIFVWQTHAVGLALPEKFRLAFLDGMAGEMEFTQGDVRATLEGIWHDHAQVIHDRVWRPLASVCPRAGLEIAQAMALAELTLAELGGCATELEMVEGTDKETTAQFYARMNAELLAKGGAR